VALLARNQSLVMIILRQCQLLLQLCQQRTFSWPVAGASKSCELHTQRNHLFLKHSNLLLNFGTPPEHAL
jgi:hypothetical protein